MAAIVPPNPCQRMPQFQPAQMGAPRDSGDGSKRAQASQEPDQKSEKENICRCHRKGTFTLLILFVNPFGRRAASHGRIMPL